MKKKLIGATIGAFVGAFVVILALSFGEKTKADTTVSPGLGWILDSSTTTSVVTVTDRRTQGGTITNKGAATVYINWAGIADVAANTTEGINKCYLDSGDSVRVPKSCTTWSHETASGTAKLLYVEE